MLTRRGILTAFGTAVSAQIFSPVLRAMELTGFSAGHPMFAGHGVTSSGAAYPLILLYPGDEGFDALVKSNFPGLLKKKRFGWIKNSAALVGNAGSSAIHGFRFKWSVQDKNSDVQTYKRTFLRRPSVQLAKRQHTGTEAFLAPGEIGLVTPLFFWSAAGYAAERKKFKLDRKQLLTYSLRYPQAREFARVARTGSDLSLLNRGIVLPTGTVGAGHKKLKRSLVSRQQAEQDEALSLLNTANTVAAVATLKQAAEANRASHLLAAKTAVHGAYYRARATFAQRVQYSIAAGASMSAMVNKLKQTASATTPACA